MKSRKLATSQSVCKRTFIFSLAGVLVLTTAHRLPAPIQESQETPSPTTIPQGPSLTVPPASAWAGERFPETRMGMLKPDDIKTWDSEKLRYAINEMYARGGYDFRTREIKQVFMQLSWYRERLVNGRTQDEAFAHLSALERANLELLQGARRAKQ